MQVARFYYHTLGFSDVLLVRFDKLPVAAYQKQEDLVSLYDETQTLIGYNVLHASKHFTALQDGGYFTSEKMQREFNHFLKAQGQNEIEYDNEPKFVVGKVIQCEPHPGSSKLHICQVDIGSKIAAIVCGASNVRDSLRVVAALPKATLPNGKMIEQSEVMGVVSEGMLCSFKELQIPVEKTGIIELDDSYIVGTAFAREGVK